MRGYNEFMAFHHVAIAARDLVSVDRFYSQAMGFELARVVIAQTPEGGWAKHFFYEAGDGQLIAFWELHDESLGEEYPTALSGGAGLPAWVNHLAFRATSRVQLEERRDHWLACGYGVLEIDHDWCQSIYTTDPGGTLVEWCWTTREASEEDRARARLALERDDLPHDEHQAAVQMHQASVPPLHER